jgi:hypothetical protein
MIMCTQFFYRQMLVVINSQYLNQAPPSRTPSGVSAQLLELRLGDNVHITLITEMCHSAFMDIFCQIILSKDT